MDSDQGKNERKKLLIPMFISIMGILSIIASALIFPSILALFSEDGFIEPITMKRIHNAQIYLIINGLFFLILGFLTAKTRIFSRILKNERQENVAMLLVSVVWIFIMGECLLRILPLPTTKEILEQSFSYEPSAFCMYRLATRDHDVLNPDGTIRAIQRNGYRGEAFPFQKEDDEIRIVIMGGSFVFDPYTDYQKDFPNLLEQRLKHKGFPNVRVINGGVPGHRTSDSMGRLLNEVHLLEPDYIVLCHAWNDIKYFRNLTPEHNLLRRIKSLNKATHKDYPPSPLINIIEGSQIFLRIKSLPQLFSHVRFGVEGRIPEGEITNQYSDWALKQYRLNVETFVDACRNFSAVPILFTQPRLVALDNTEEDKKHIGYKFSLLTHEALCRALADCDSIIKSVAEAKNANYFDFASYFVGRRECWTDHIHFNENGSSWAAAVLTEYFNEILEKKRY